jgi:hypothetical protein
MFLFACATDYTVMAQGNSRYKRRLSAITIHARIGMVK